MYTFFFAYCTSCRQLGTPQLKSPPTRKMLLMHRWPTTSDEGPTDTDNATLAMTVRKRTCDRKQSTKDDHGNNSKLAVDIIWYGRVVGPRSDCPRPRRRSSSSSAGGKDLAGTEERSAGKRFVDSKYRPRASAWRWQDGSITMNQSMTELVLPHHDEIGVR